MLNFEKDDKKVEVPSTQQQRADQRKIITAALMKSGMRLGENTPQKIASAKQKIRELNQKEDQGRQP